MGYGKRKSTIRFGEEVKGEGEEIEMSENPMMKGKRKEAGAEQVKVEVVEAEEEEEEKEETAGGRKWSEHWSAENECNYYCDEATGETVWEKPEGMK